MTTFYTEESIKSAQRKMIKTGKLTREEATALQSGFGGQLERLNPKSGKYYRLIQHEPGNEKRYYSGHVTPFAVAEWLLDGMTIKEEEWGPDNKIMFRVTITNCPRPCSCLSDSRKSAKEYGEQEVRKNHHRYRSLLTTT